MHIEYSLLFFSKIIENENYIHQMLQGHTIGRRERNETTRSRIKEVNQLLAKVVAANEDQSDNSVYIPQHDRHGKGQKHHQCTPHEHLVKAPAACNKRGVH